MPAVLSWSSEECSPVLISILAQDLYNAISGRYYCMVWRDVHYEQDWGIRDVGLRRILKIPWTARRTNDEILRMINKNRELLDTIKRRKTAYLGHVRDTNFYSW